ncbi:N-acyl homoserine lactonase family protein [Sphingomonas sp. ST-64]|uniref:N-acyl homoserine lactonase family protein n=1 Tax=Sphingomonas plantiphila TaxID=3163295 RepID=A0ABW8YRD7_9SPHN
MHRLALAAGAALMLMGQAAPSDPEMRLWRLDCGTLEVSDFGPFSDTRDYDGQPRDIVDSCYLVKHGADYLLWDTGLPASLIGKPATEWVFTYRMTTTLRDQLRTIGVKPDQIRYVGISHYHDDHTGQARDFPGATLLIGAQDWEAIRTVRPQSERDRFQPWIGGGAKVEPVDKDRDVFGDGSVTILAMPGHTPGHRALLVKLPRMGNVLLSGDQFHAQESYDKGLVPAFNFDRTDTLASHDRFKGIVRSLKATVIIQHEAADVKKLPAFPKSAE